MNSIRRVPQLDGNSRATTMTSASAAARPLLLRPSMSRSSIPISNSSSVALMQRKQANISSASTIPTRGPKERESTSASSLTRSRWGTKPSRGSFVLHAKLIEKVVVALMPLYISCLVVRINHGMCSVTNHSTQTNRSNG